MVTVFSVKAIIDCSLKFEYKCISPILLLVIYYYYLIIEYIHIIFGVFSLNFTNDYIILLSSISI